MKIKLIGVTFLSFFIVFGMVACDFINWNELPWNKKQEIIKKEKKTVPEEAVNKDWAVKINDDPITIDEFYKFYYTQNKILLNMSKEEINQLAEDPSMVNHPTLNKSKFMDFIISRKLLYDRALKDKSIDNEELKTIMKLFKLQGVATYYLSEKLKDEVIISDEEIDQYYKKNKDKYKGLPVDDNLIADIRQRIFLQKFEQASSEFVMNLIAESKVEKQGFKDHLRQEEEKRIKDKEQEVDSGEEKKDPPEDEKDKAQKNKSKNKPKKK